MQAERWNISLPTPLLSRCRSISRYCYMRTPSLGLLPHPFPNSLLTSTPIPPTFSPSQLSTSGRRSFSITQISGMSVIVRCSVAFTPVGVIKIMPFMVITCSVIVKPRARPPANLPPQLLPLLGGRRPQRLRVAIFATSSMLASVPATSVLMVASMLVPSQGAMVPILGTIISRELGRQAYLHRCLPRPVTLPALQLSWFHTHRTPHHYDYLYLPFHHSQFLPLVLILCLMQTIWLYSHSVIPMSFLLYRRTLGLHIFPNIQIDSLFPL